ncbi:hypothetical protein Tco_1561151 [Tanacetum coccineum]
MWDTRRLPESISDLTRLGIIRVQVVSEKGCGLYLMLLHPTQSKSLLRASHLLGTCAPRHDSWKYFLVHPEEAIIPVLQRVKGFGVTLRGVLPLSLVKRHPPRVVGRDAIVYEFEEFRVHTDFALQKIHNGILGARQLGVQAL